ncbi:hypothetical protein BF17_03025 [Yersinia similis]|uniref:Type VI secretion protein n=2 Tax=Yersinia similis TaxID=367190 RepID=A0ABN4CI69_9GAMM|nr:hypothetical protein BF17_03025 [Yersinia similis]CFQ70826.1 Uncharacterised protein [Yersinia similis]
MPVNLKLIPTAAMRPNQPKWWVWLLLLLAGLLGGTAYAILSSSTKPEINAETFWGTALALPALSWLTLLVLRMAWYKGNQAMANGWNKDREKTIQRETERGRRFLQVLGVSLHSALREPDDTNGQLQLNALQEKTQSLKTQASWLSDEGIRHSRLFRLDNETPEQLLARGLNKTLEELSLVLASVPADVSLALLVESNSCLSDSQIQAIWQQSWADSHIRQPVTRIEGSGLATLDQWLDQGINKKSLLLVVALQVAPEQPEGTAEAVVGLLLGNAWAQTELKSLASLHRPEQAHDMGTQDLHYAMGQSLDWVPVSAEAVTSGWLVGVDATYHGAIATGLKALSSPINIGQDLHDLGSTLGYPGPAAPWLAIACATGASKPQLIMSGDGLSNTPLWATIVMPSLTS